MSVTALRDEYAVIIGYLLIGTDNTARKQVEEEQKKLDQVLQENNIKLQNAMSAAEKANLAKSDWLSSMGHELRMPLSAILGFAQLIESGKLALSPEPISLTEVMREYEAMVEPQASKHHIAVRFPALATEYIVRADRTRFKQILINLLSNAIKYNKPGGKVTVDIVAVSPERLRICVADTGAGLPPEQVAQLFQPFNRLGREGNADEGTGSGLVMTKRLVEMNLTHERQSMTPADAAAAAAQPQGPIDNNIRTLLYVEDNPANRMLVETLRERRPGIRLLTAGDGWRGIALARQEQPDVILMDINLPGIKALKILENDPLTTHIPIVALSANAMPYDIVKGLEAGFFRYLTKPIQARLLVANDQVVIVQLLEQLLHDAGYTAVMSTMHPENVCELHRTHDFNLIVLDVKMPARAELGASEARFHGLTELASDWYWEQNATGDSTAVCGPVAEMLGLDVRRLFAVAQAPPGDGSRQTFHVSGAPMFDRQGRYTGYGGIGHALRA